MFQNKGDYYKLDYMFAYMRRYIFPIRNRITRDAIKIYDLP